MTYPFIIAPLYSLKIFAVKTFANCPETAKFVKVKTFANFAVSGQFAKVLTAVL